MTDRCQSCVHRDGKKCEIWKTVKRAAEKGPCDLYEEGKQ